MLDGRLSHALPSLDAVHNHDAGSPWYGLHEVEFGDDGKIAWWDREPATFECAALEGQESVTQSLMAAANDAERWPALKASELPE